MVKLGETDAAIKDLLDLKGRVAIVTGAGQGVGRRTALHLLNTMLEP